MTSRPRGYVQIHATDLRRTAPRGYKPLMRQRAARLETSPRGRLAAHAEPSLARMWRPQAMVGIALLVGLALYATVGRDRVLLSQNAQLRALLAASVQSEAVAASASKVKAGKLEQENELLRAQLIESAAAAAAAVLIAAPSAAKVLPGGTNWESKRKLLADRTNRALCPAPIRTVSKCTYVSRYGHCAAALARLLERAHVLTLCLAYLTIARGRSSRRKARLRSSCRRRTCEWASRSLSPGP